MVDEYGVPQPTSGDDWQQFMLGLFDTIEQASDLGASAEGIKLLGQAREVFKQELAVKFPGHGTGRATS